MVTQRQLMLAGKLDPAKVNYVHHSMFASAKLDGIRAVVMDEVVYSRNMKPIPNEHVQARFGLRKYNGYDGELIVGSPMGTDVFNRTTKIVMSHNGWDPELYFYVFDILPPQREPGMGYNYRHAAIRHDEGIKKVVQIPVYDTEALQTLMDDFVDQGYEGLMLRDGYAPYKYGRSTAKEHGLLKYKLFEDFEARVIGYTEELHNTNDKDDSGKRTSHKAGKIGKGTMGNLVVVGINGKVKGVEFEVGTGFTAAQRAELWATQTPGLVCTVKYVPYGSIDKPRHPVFKGWRTDL